MRTGISRTVQGSAKRSADFVKQEQEEISPNHVQAFIPGPVELKKYIHVYITHYKS